MAITLVGANTGIVDPAATSLELTAPSGIAANDLIVIIFAQPEDEDGDISTPTGFTALLANSPVGGSLSSKPALSIFYKVATASEGSSYTVSVTNVINTGGAGLVAAYRGVDTTTPIDVSPSTSTSASTANPNPPAITIVTDGAYAICGAIVDGVSVGTLTLPTGYTAQTGSGRRYNANGGNGLQFYYAHKLTSGTGSEDPSAFGTGGSADQTMAYTFAIRPAAGSGGGGGSRRIFIT